MVDLKLYISKFKEDVENKVTFVDNINHILRPYKRMLHDEYLYIDSRFIFDESDKNYFDYSIRTINGYDKVPNFNIFVYREQACIKISAYQNIGAFKYKYGDNKVRMRHQSEKFFNIKLNSSKEELFHLYLKEQFVDEYFELFNILKDNLDYFLEQF